MSKNISCRAAALIIKDDKLLFAKNINHPCYYLIGGGIEENETSEEAVIREIFEETGLKLEVDKLAMIQERFCEVEKQKRHEIAFFYLIKNTGSINIQDNTFTDQGTNETLHWLPVNNLEKFNIVPMFLRTKSFDNFGRIEHIIVKEY